LERETPQLQASWNALRTVDLASHSLISWVFARVNMWVCLHTTQMVSLCLMIHSHSARCLVGSTGEVRMPSFQSLDSGPDHGSWELYGFSWKLDIVCICFVFVFLFFTDDSDLHNWFSKEWSALVLARDFGECFSQCLIFRWRSAHV
jgi:hypothetical protein